MYRPGWRPEKQSVKVPARAGFEAAFQVLSARPKTVTGPRRRVVESSYLQSAGYKLTGPGIGNLEIKFLNGPELVYYDVPKSVYVAFESAKSKGGYFYKHIRSNFEWSHK